MDTVSHLCCDCLPSETPRECYTTLQLQLVAVMRACSETTDSLNVLPVQVTVFNESRFRWLLLHARLGCVDVIVGVRLCVCVSEIVTEAVLIPSLPLPPPTSHPWCDRVVCASHSHFSQRRLHRCAHLLRVRLALPERHHRPVFLPLSRHSHSQSLRHHRERERYIFFFCRYFSGKRSNGAAQASSSASWLGTVSSSRWVPSHRSASNSVSSFARTSLTTRSSHSRTSPPGACEVQTRFFFFGTRHSLPLHSDGNFSFASFSALSLRVVTQRTAQGDPVFCANITESGRYFPIWRLEVLADACTNSGTTSTGTGPNTGTSA